MQRKNTKHSAYVVRRKYFYVKPHISLRNRFDLFRKSRQKKGREKKRNQEIKGKKEKKKEGIKQKLKNFSESYSELISKCPFGVFKSTKKTTKLL